MNKPLMAKATAVWLIDNTTLTFEQIAEFCELHPLEVKGIADGEVAAGIKGLDPITSGQLTREEIAKAEAAASGKPMPAPAEAPAAAPGPTAAEVQAAGSMTAEDRSKMIADMVARLDERLKTSGGTIADWERLIRAYRVMGRSEEATAAIGRARAALAADPAAAARLDALAAEK